MADGFAQGHTRVIGVVANIRQSGLEDSVGAEVFAPMAQRDPEGGELVVRSNLPPEMLAASVIGVLRARGSKQLAADFRPVQEMVDHSVSPRRFIAGLVVAFGALGLILAALGIYGVISYSVTRQTQEIGIRMALGARASQVQLRVIAKTLRLTLAGVAVGALAALACSKWIALLLFGIKPTDPATFGVIVVLLCIVAIIAGYIPARRASRIDPVEALRGD